MNSNEFLSATKQLYRQQLAAIKDKHAQQAKGLEICRQITGLVDQIVIQVFERSVGLLKDDERAQVEDSISLVAQGGFGRREMAPYSDVDLMILHDGMHPQVVEKIASRITKDVFDIGLKLGLSVRTPREVNQLFTTDATIFTALAESRFLCGAKTLFDRFFERFAYLAKRRSQYLIDLTEQARRDERLKFGETVYLLRPNVKRSRGGLRDIQFVRWAAFARYGIVDFDELLQRELLTEPDHETLKEAREFMLRLRNELHFHAGKAQDVLGRREQLRLAEFFGYQGNEFKLPVEQFMGDYFRHTSNVRYSSFHFLATAKTRSRIGSLVGPVFSVSFEGDFRVGPIHVGGTRQGMEKLTRNVVDVLRLMELSNAFNRRIDHSTWVAIREAMLKRRVVDITPEVAERFIALLAEPRRLASLLRRLHEMGVLEQIIPEFKHATALLQFNEYHKYTVDEHTMRAVEFATQCGETQTPLGSIYRSIKQKAILHLAILLHDIGKGYNEDHSEVGARIAVAMGKRFGLSERETETLRYLVHRHLVMAHLAFYRNLDDEAVIAEFASEVGSVEVLKMLYVLTCADLAAVGPDVLNDWKLTLLTRLYERALEQLSGVNRFGATHPKLLEVIQMVHRKGYDDKAVGWFDHALRELPSSYFWTWTKTEIFDRLDRARQLKSDESAVWASYSEESQSVEFCLVTHDRSSSGYFHRLTGVLSSNCFEIRSVDVTELDETRVLFRFRVIDSEFADCPPKDRLEETKKQILAVVNDEVDNTPTFRKVWGATEVSPEIPRLPSRVEIDNESTDQYTVIDVFCHDRIGLLYDVTRTLFSLKLEIRVAKVGTYLDQVVDVFYVTDFEGSRITDEDRLREITSALMSTLQIQKN